MNRPTRLPQRPRPDRTGHLARCSWPRRASVAGLLVAGLSACSPAFNWREWRADGAGLQALMPCKPEHATRTVPLAGKQTALYMHSCEAGGLRFALAWVRMDNEAELGQARAGWQAASLQAIKAPPTSGSAWQVHIAGAAEATGLTAQGRDPQGQAVHARFAYFSQGAQLYQAAVYGPSLPHEPIEAFFGGLRFAPP